MLFINFYAKIRKDTEIGHFFNEVIEDWNEHLEKLTNFWEMNLLKHIFPKYSFFFGTEPFLV